MDVPNELKQLKRFFRESKKAEKTAPILAYYCRLYAVIEASKLPQNKKSPNVNKWIGEQINSLEKIKPNISKEEAKEQILNIANNVFDQADNIDRAGNSDKVTAAMFNSAFVFYTILRQFGEIDKTYIERTKYCLYKTTDILKCINEGVKPKPGPPNENPEENALLESEFNNIPTDNTNNMDDNNNSDSNLSNTNNNFSQPINSSSSQPFNSSSSQPFNSSSSQPFNSSSSQPFNSSSSQPFNSSSSQPFNSSSSQPFNSSSSQPFNSSSQPFNSSSSQPLYPSSQPHPSPYSTPSFSQPQPQPQPQPQVKPSSTTTTKQPSQMTKAEFKKFENKVLACQEAEKIMKHAFSAMKFNDVDASIKKLQEAIEVLKPYQGS